MTTPLSFCPATHVTKGLCASARGLRSSRHRWFPLVVLALACRCGGPSAPSEPGSGPSSLPPPPPARYAALYGELASGLAQFERTVDGRWNGARTDVRFAGTLSPANGNRVRLMEDARAEMLRVLEALRGMGVRVIKFDITYPLLTPAFHDHLRRRNPRYVHTARDFVDYYRMVASEARARGLGLMVEHSTLLSAFSSTDPTSYFDQIRGEGPIGARQRYADERAAEALTIATEVSPDHLGLLEEPDTQNSAFGPVGGRRLFDEDQWTAYVEGAAELIRSRLPGRPIRLGAGTGTWESRAYVERFVRLPSLNYVNFHVYPLAVGKINFFQRLLDLGDYVRSAAPEKGITVGEAWLYKVGAAEDARGINDPEIFSRDVYSFWQTLDQRFLEIFYKVAHQQRLEVFAPFWSEYFFAYLKYEEVSGLPPAQLFQRSYQAAMAAAARGDLTGTGLKYREILAR